MLVPTRRVSPHATRHIFLHPQSLTDWSVVFAAAFGLRDRNKRVSYAGLDVEESDEESDGYDESQDLNEID